MKALIDINMDTKAFDEEPREELAWILERLARDIVKHCGGHALLDTNAETVGHFHFAESNAPTATELLKSLKGMVRIVEAFGYGTRLGTTQKRRLDEARALIAKANGDVA